MTDQFEVSIDVHQICGLVVNDLYLGIVTDLSQAYAESTIGAVTCTSAASGQISFDVGDGGGSFELRQMKQGTAVIDFNIYASPRSYRHSG